MAYRGTLEFEHKLSVDIGCVRTKFGGAQSRDRDFRTENRQKVVNFKPLYLGNYQYWWKKVCVFWTYCLRPL